MGPPIPIIGDTPRLDPQLGFESYAIALADAIKGGNPPQFTIGVYDAWGSGKSSLLNAIARQLSNTPNVIPVLFDAWRYEETSHIVVPLLHAIYSELNKIRDDTLTDKVRTALLSVVRSLTISIGPLSISGASLGASDTTQNISDLDMAFEKPYRDIKAIAQSLDGRRIGVLIDDLDRCSPAKVVGLLEAINLVMDVPGFIFVLALDYEVLARAVTERHPHASGHVFIEKMVQVPFRVPRLELPQEGFLEELIPDWTELSKSLPDDFEQIAYDVATLGLEANPRQIKRLINSVLVLLNVAQDRGVSTDARLLAGLVGVQLRWPAEYRDFVEAVLADDPNPLTAITPEDQPGLLHYSERFFTTNTSAETLRPYLQLTQSVAIPDTGDGDIAEIEAERKDVKPAATIREENKEELVATLVEQGYRTFRTPSIYMNKRNPDFRVKFGKTVVRFEAKSEDGNWQLGQSYLLTREYTEAKRLIENPSEMLRAVYSGASKYVPGALSLERLKQRNADLRSMK